MRAELRAKLWMGIAYFVVLEALIVAAMLYWPQFAKNLEHLKALIPLDVLRDMADKIDESGASAYVHAQHFFKACNALGGLVAVLFAMNAVALEAQRGTLEIWLARALSRRRLLLERWFAGAFWLCVPVLVSTATVPWLGSLVDEPLDLGLLLLCALHQCLFLLAIYSLTFLASSASSNPMAIGFSMLLAAITELSVYMIERLTHWSVFRFADVGLYQEIYDGGALPWRVSLPLAAVSLVCVLLALHIFARRTP
ncbi:MAG: ABC transporter permease subunit [Planctomycetes bacterium]|nr:ABC transporter permease subunit [Planctomycetota bacterium]